MSQVIKHQIIELVLKAARLAKGIGIEDILQPGLIKEMIIANILGHELITSKHDSDAHAPGNPNEKYEYLTCKEKGSFQFDRIFKNPREKREKSLNRIIRNTKIYFAIFYKENPLKCKIIYEINSQDVLEEAERKLDNSKNEISHVGFSIKWIHKKGRIVYKNSGDS